LEENKLEKFDFSKKFSSSSTSLDTLKSRPFTSPHYNSFSDIDGDCVADLVNKIYNIILEKKKKNYFSQNRL
jgi:hypothetical protein